MAVTLLPLAEKGDIVAGDPAEFLVTLPTPLAEGLSPMLTVGALPAVALTVDVTRTLLSLRLTVAQVTTAIGTTPTTPDYSALPFRVATGTGDTLVPWVAGHLTFRSKWQGRGRYKALTAEVSAAGMAQAAASAAALSAAAASGASDVGIAGVLGTPGGVANALLSSTYAPLSGNIDATVRKLADDFADVNILVMGDSAASQAGQFPDLLMAQVQALYPHRTLQKATWDNTGHVWGSFATVGTAGTGTFKVKFWQGAATGTTCEQPLNYFDTWVGSVQPDLVIIHHGHNYGATAAGGSQPDDTTMDYVFRERYLRFVAEIKRACPRADVLVTSQNPYLTAGARSQISNIRAQVMREVAADIGCAYGPVLEAYLATGNPAAYLAADLLHPTTSGATNGAQLAADTLLPLFRVKAGHEVSARLMSPLLDPGANLLTNGDFSLFASPPTLTGWTAGGSVTLTKDVTNYESVNGYSVKGVGTAAAYGTIYQLLPIRKVRGQIVTLAARFYLPTATAGTESGRVHLSGDGGTVTTLSGSLTLVRDNWVWAFITARIPVAATYATMSVRFGVAVGNEASVDRAVCVLGHLPRT